MLQLKVRESHNRMKAGTTVRIDDIKVDTSFASGVGVRVIGVWATPKWFDIGFFFDAEHIVNTKLAETYRVDE